MATLTGAQRQQKLRDSRKNDGLVEVRVRVPPQFVATVKDLEVRLRATSLTRCA